MNGSESRGMRPDGGLNESLRILDVWNSLTALMDDTISVYGSLVLLRNNDGATFSVDFS